MRRKNSERVGDMLRYFWKDNPEVYHTMLEERVKRLWGELLGQTVSQYTSNIYIKNRVLYVSMTSSVVRSEMLSVRQQLVKTLNEHAGSDVIDDIMIR